MKKILLLSVCLTFLPCFAGASIKVIEAESSYVMGDNDSKIDARRIAIQEAKRKVLEEAGTFVASLTEVKDYRLTKDEVTAYTAGVVETEIVNEEMRGSVDKPEIHIKARCKVDTDVLTEQINQYRENEEMKEQLIASQKEVEALKKEREDLQKQLSQEKDKAKAEETRKKIDAVLTHEESIDDTNRVLTNLSPKIDVYEAKESKEISEKDINSSIDTLKKAVRINPKNYRARLMLVKLLERKGENSAAERELREMLAANPKSLLLHLRMGMLLRKQGKYEEALKEFNLVERAKPHEPLLLFQTGLTHKALGNCREAVIYLKRFLERTREIKRPAIMKAKAKAVAVIKECRPDRPIKHQPLKRR